MRYHILLALICLSMVYVTIPSFVAAGNNSSGSAFFAAEENPVIEITDVFIEPAQTREFLKTPNGLDLIVEKITNFRDVPQNIIVQTSTDDKTFYFNVTISPNITWSFGKLGNFLIIPQNDAVVTSATSYYAEGDELVIVLEGDTEELFIHVGEKGAPRLVITNTDTFWSYDIRNNMVKIMSNNNNVSTVIMFWAGSDAAVSFIEDTRKKENLRHSIVELNDHILQLQSDLATEEENVAKLRSDLSKSNEEIEKARLEKLQEEKFAGELKVSIEKGENLISASVVMSPVQAAVGIVVVLILIVLTADALLFKPRKRYAA